MCWKSKFMVAPKMATSDIKVYKILEVKDEELKSPCQEFKWNIGVVYKAYMTSSPSYKVYKGFHCMRYIPINCGLVWGKSNRDILLSRYLRDKIFEALIPAGSMYYENEDGEIVSNQLEILKPLDCDE